jgi:hypothetical protein
LILPMVVSVVKVLGEEVPSFWIVGVVMGSCLPGGRLLPP